MQKMAKTNKIQNNQISKYNVRSRMVARFKLSYNYPKKTMVDLFVYI